MQYDPANYLNIWICNIGGGILGYAQFPGGSAATDGVVIGPNFFGSSAGSVVVTTARHTIKAVRLRMKLATG